MSRRDSITNGELNDSQYYILASLVTPRHGYAVMKLLMNVDTQTIHIGPATLYTTLKQLVDTGLVVRCVSDTTNKIYVITAEGQERLTREIARKQAMVEFAQRALTGRTSNE